MRGRRHLTALLFLAPNLLGFAAFTLVPVLLSFAGSFTNWSLRPAAPLRFVGLDNYTRLLDDKNFWFYLYNTGYLLLALPFAIGGALFLATQLHDGFVFRAAHRGPRLGVCALGVAFVSAGLLVLTGSPNLGYVVFALGLIAAAGLAFGAVTYRTVFYLPHFTAGAATILLWTQLYNPSFGLINGAVENLARFLGFELDGPGWLTSSRSLLGFLPLPDHFNNGGFGLGAREAIMIMGIWTAIGGNNLILFLAGLANIPPELNEAAAIDGASRWQRFRHVTFPQLAPTTFFIVVISIIGGLQGGFEQARLMTAGGPAGATTTLSYYIYIQGFERLDLGYGSAVAWVLFAIVFAFTLLQWRYGRRDGTD